MYVCMFVSIRKYTYVTLSHLRSKGDTFDIIIIITSTKDLQPSTVISNLSSDKSVLNKFKPY